MCGGVEYERPPALSLRLQIISEVINFVFIALLKKIFSLILCYKMLLDN